MVISTQLLVAQSRLKDISSFSGIESKSIVGYGLVVGLQGSGDGSSSQMTIQSIMNMLEHFGLTVPMSKVKPNNVAAVMVTAELPAFGKLGSQFDVTVSSIGDAKSLEGGVLLLTPLIGPDGKQYASAQGSISIGGFNEETKNAKIRKNHANVGRVPNGASVEKEIYSQLVTNGELLLNLQTPDFTTAQTTAASINRLFRSKIANAEDAASISISVPDSVLARHNLIGFMSRIENVEIQTDLPAKIIINERTGTIVAGNTVRINEVAIAHGNLIIEIRNKSVTNQVGPYVQQTSESKIKVGETGSVVVMQATTVQELSRALNSIKVTPRDLISIFQALKAAGALQGELQIL